MRISFRLWKWRPRPSRSAPGESKVCSLASVSARSPDWQFSFSSTALTTGWPRSVNFSITFLRTCSVRFQRRRRRAKLTCCNRTMRVTFSLSRTAIFAPPFSSCPTTGHGQRPFWSRAPFRAKASPPCLLILPLPWRSPAPAPC